MEDLSLPKKPKDTRLPRNPWNDARILMHVNSTVGQTYDLERLGKIIDTDAMTTRTYNRSNPTEIGNEGYYNNSGKGPFNYLGNNDSVMPMYSINTVHLQNPYREFQRLEGYASRDQSKNMLQAQDSNLRWRYNNLITNRQSMKSNELGNEKRSQKKKSSVCSELNITAKQYCSYSTLHGLRYVGDSSLSIGERIFWIISFIIALLTAIYYICYIYQKWNLSPIIISLSPEPMALNEFPFPSITVCNMNNVKRTEAKRIEQGSDQLDKLLMEDICNSDGNITYQEEVIDWSRMLRFMINVSQPCTDMLYYCLWHGNQTDCEKIFNPTMTDEGICCNFNAVHRKYLFYNAHDWSDLNITFPFVSIDWNAESGYNKSVPADAIPWRPYGAGLFYGLTLVLDVDKAEYYCSSTASVGFKMLLHNPVETPKIADFSFAIAPGKETRVIVRPRISTASRSILSIPQRKRKCFFTSERKLRYYRTYTQRNCILECEANFTQKICQCVQYYMPKSSNTHICGKKDEQCAMLAKRTMELKLYDEEIANPLNITEVPNCKCWPGCFEINYRAELSQSKLLSSFDIDQRFVKKNKDYFTENMAVVHLFFVDSQFTKYVKNELFGFTEFLSSTGGLLGLFMGFSFLSFMEILYFSTMRLWCRWYGQKTSSRPAMLQIQPFHHKRKVIYPFAN